MAEHPTQRMTDPRRLLLIATVAIVPLAPMAAIALERCSRSSATRPRKRRST
jgi:hypothetical protein